jgi:hypothetical protein
MTSFNFCAGSEADINNDMVKRRAKIFLTVKKYSSLTGYNRITDIITKIRQDRAKFALMYEIT